jgi:hypothetical protein
MFRDHTQAHHIRWSSCERTTDASQRTLPAIRTRNPSKRVATDRRLRPRDHWHQPYKKYCRSQAWSLELIALYLRSLFSVRNLQRIAYWQSVKALNSHFRWHVCSVVCSRISISTKAILNYVAFFFFSNLMDLTCWLAFMTVFLRSCSVRYILRLLCALSLSRYASCIWTLFLHFFVRISFCSFY